MFWKRKPKPVELTTEAYQRWLRAQRPPEFKWFLGQPVIVQEAMAEKGDEYATDMILALAYAIQNPQAAEAGIDAAANVQSEEQLVAALAQQFASKLGTPNVPTGTSDVPPRETLGGFGDRRQAHIAARREAKRNGSTFLGRKPDTVTE